MEKVFPASKDKQLPPIPPFPSLSRSVTESSHDASYNRFAALGADTEPDKMLRFPPIASATLWGGNTGASSLASCDDDSWKTVGSRRTKRMKRRSEDAMLRKVHAEEEDAREAPAAPLLVPQRLELVRDDGTGRDPRSPATHRHAFAYVEEEHVGSG